MIHIIITDICIMLTTVIAAADAGSVSAYPLLLLGSVLMILATMSFMRDDKDKKLIVLQMILSLLFVLSAGQRQWYAGLVLILVPLKRRWIRLVLTAAPFIFMVFGEMAVRRSVDEDNTVFLAYKIKDLMMLIGVSLIIMLIQTMIKKTEIQRKAMAARLQQVSLSEMHEIKRNADIMQQSFYERKNARLLERENISRNIHNSVGHSITAAIMTLDAADMLFEKNPDEAHKRMNDASGRIRGSLEAIRSAVRALDTEDEDVSIKDLLCYTDNIINEFTMDTQITCDCLKDLYSENLMLPKEHAEFLSGALSEMLTNGVKHGQATHFTVKITADSTHIRLEVKDNGNSGFNEGNYDELIRNGFGLKKLTSYAQRCGGSTEYKNEDGFYSAIELPVRNERD